MSQIRTGQIGTAGDAWLTWVPTITGFTTPPTGGVYRYIQIGKTVILQIDGVNTATSNSTGFTMSLPVTAATVTNGYWGAPAQVFNNSAPVSGVGFVKILSGGTVLNVYIDFAENVTTASGTKRLTSCQIIYEAA